MKFWITVEYNADNEPSLKGKSKEEMITFVKNECAHIDFEGVLKLIKVEEAPNQGI